VARLLGDSLRDVKTRDGPYLVQNNIDAHANFLIGGQIRGEPPRLFNVYGEGNFIEATPDTCYFQIGETKYGKPIIDRVLKRSTSLLDATKCTVVSFDSTMRSNISVGLPIDLLVYETDSLRSGCSGASRNRSVFPDGARAVGRGAPPGVRAASRSRLDLSTRRWPFA
jgi:putative proteasome-type protease